MASAHTKRDLSVLVVDDSAVYRKILKEVLASIPGAELLATAANGRIALEKVSSLKPDIILLDVEMPEMNGLETLKAIREHDESIGVIMVSGAGKNPADVTVAALEMGAVDFVTKPDGKTMEVNRRSLVERLTPIMMSFATQKALNQVRKHGAAVAKRSLEPASPIAVAAAVPAPVSLPAETAFEALPARVEVVVIGVSTGGPNALGVVIPTLPADLGVPVLIVQHMPPVFTASLANSLNEKSYLGVVEAAAGDIITANRVYVAPGGFHMVARRGEDSRPVIGLNQNPPENSCRPAVDVLFRSVATLFGGNVLAVIMTGMGQDGLNGVRMLKQRGAYAIAQDEATSTVYGMPMAISKAGLADEDLPLQQIGPRIGAIVRGRHP